VIKPIPADNFARIQPIIDKWEGGFTDDPQDPGGATNMGITQADLKRWRQRDVTKDDVRSLTHDEAMRIFKAFYWDPLRCDEMPVAAALMSYNAGVNSGLGRSARWLQQSLNKQGLNLDVDGSVGPLTLSACTQADVTRLVNDFAAAQEGFLGSLPTFSHFGTGWMNRMNDVKARALAMANEPVVLPKGPVPTALPTSALQSILEILKEKAMASTAPSLAPPPSPGPPSPADLTPVLQQVANVLQKINLAPSATAVVPGQQQQQQAAQLQKIFDFIASVLNPAGQPQVLGQVNGALGDTIGNLLNGKKTAIGILGTLLTAWLSKVPLTASGTGLVSVLSMIASSVPGLSGFTMPLFLALSAWGVLGKLEKWAQGTAPPPQPSK
jgi:peptidoglycan L-alanyl-D-glutamate endopeptidase CwlK